MFALTHIGARSGIAPLVRTSSQSSHVSFGLSSGFLAMCGAFRHPPAAERRIARPHRSPACPHRSLDRSPLSPHRPRLHRPSDIARPLVACRSPPRRLSVACRSPVRRSCIARRSPLAPVRPRPVARTLAARPRPVGSCSTSPAHTPARTRESGTRWHRPLDRYETLRCCHATAAASVNHTVTMIASTMLAPPAPVGVRCTLRLSAAPRRC